MQIFRVGTTKNSRRTKKKRPEKPVHSCEIRERKVQQNKSTISVSKIVEPVVKVLSKISTKVAQNNVKFCKTLL